MHHLADLFLNKQRKLLVTGVTGLAICGGFVFVAFKPASLEAYKVAAEWLVYLCAAYNGGNALTYFAQRGQSATPAEKPVKPTPEKPAAAPPAGAAKP